MRDRERWAVRRARYRLAETWRPEGDFIAVKTWFITGTSRGFGREWAIAALDRGDRVAATARDIASLDELAASMATRSCRSGWT